MSLLQSVVLSSQLKHMLGSLGSSGTMRLVYNNQREPFFVSKTAEKINAIFPMRFRDDTDLAIATSFFQELQEVGNSFARAPKCSWSPIPPPELRGENVHHLTTNGGFVSFGVLSRHVRGKRPPRPRGSCSTSSPTSSTTSSAPGATSRAGCGSAWRP